MMRTEGSKCCGDVKLQPLQCEMQLLSQPDGSALLSTGDTSILAAVYGPMEVRIAKELADRATVEVVYKPKIGMPGCAEKLQERLVRNTCENVIMAALHPRTAIQIVIQQLHDGGSQLACCINASCLALMDAAVPLCCMVAAVSCVIDSNGQLHVDPKRNVEAEAPIQMTFAFESKSLNVLTTSAAGNFTDEQFQICLAACKQATEQVFNFYRDTLKKKLSTDRKKKL